MGGTSYENNNVFKLINRQNQGAGGGANFAQRHNPAIHKEQSMSPPLKPIEEIVNRKNQQKAVAGACSTQSKFFVNQQQQQSVQSRNGMIIRTTKQRTRDPDLSQSFMESQAQNLQLKSYNITQEKFFPSKQQTLPTNNHPQLDQGCYQGTNPQGFKIMHQSFYNQRGNTGCDGLMNLEFNSKQGNGLIKKAGGMRGGNGIPANRQSQENMIKEEQQEEISEEDEDEGTRESDKQVESSPYQKKEVYVNQAANKRFTLEPNPDQLNFNSANQQQAAYPMHIDSRPSNRLGCSRAFHQTKENWKDGGGCNSQNHSQPRNSNFTVGSQQDCGGLLVAGGDSGQYSCKATSSASSLNVVNKHYTGGAQAVGFGNVNTSSGYPNQSTNNNSSISPKPFNKWGGGGAAVGVTQKIQEMQKEVNLMYLGVTAGATKKKAAVGVKLNPIIARPQGVALDPRANL